jgi:hypothetical protein
MVAAGGRGRPDVDQMLMGLPARVFRAMPRDIRVAAYSAVRNATQFRSRLR